MLTKKKKKISTKAKPDKPGKPEKPGKPLKPGKPEKPGKPGKPHKPGKPTKPSDPIDPTLPADPIDPTLPVDPTQPDDPVVLQPATSFEELEAQLGEQVAAQIGHRLEFNDIDDLIPELDENGELPLPPPQFDMNEIAEMAHNTVAQYRQLMFPEKGHQPIYSQLSWEHKELLKADVHEVLSTASNPNDAEVARLKHSQRAMSLLAQGMKYGPEEGPDTTILVMPWEYLPNEHRMPLILFRNIAKTLLTSVWVGH